MAKLSVIVPVYNEVNLIAPVVDQLMATKSTVEREWIFVDDGSTDGTPEKLKELAKKYKFELVLLEKNAGKGNACKVGIHKATGDLTMIQDADFEYDHNDVPKLLVPLLENQADVVYGSRFKPSAQQVHRTYHFFVNRFLTVLSNLFSGIYLTDMETCFKIFRSDLLKSMQLQSDRFGIEVELTAYVSKTSARVYELPISYHPRTRLQGKKINWKDGLAALSHLLKYNFFVSKESAFSRLPDRYKV